MSEKLKKSIFQTLAFFDIFDYPLTSEELYRWLWRDIDSTAWLIDYTDFLERLDKLRVEGLFSYRQGYYFLLGREEIIELRQRSVRLIEEKMKIAKQAVKKIRWVPFVRAVFVCNTLASASVTVASDIDVFIIIRAGRIWLSRFLVTLTLSLFRLRRTKKKIKNKICLSFYVTDESLDLSSIGIEETDIYLVYWLDQLIPIYDPENMHKEIKRKNLWAKEYIPGGFKGYQLFGRWRVEDSKFSKLGKNSLQKLWGTSYGDLIEAQARGLQKMKMKRNIDSMQNEDDTRVIINDSMLKFHENDRRQYYRDRWQDAVCKLCGS